MPSSCQSHQLGTKFNLLLVSSIHVVGFTFFMIFVEGASDLKKMELRALNVSKQEIKKSSNIIMKMDMLILLMSKYK